MINSKWSDTIMAHKQATPLSLDTATLNNVPTDSQAETKLFCTILCVNIFHQRQVKGKMTSK